MTDVCICLPYIVVTPPNATAFFYSVQFGQLSDRVGLQDYTAVFAHISLDGCSVLCQRTVLGKDVDYPVKILRGVVALVDDEQVLIGLILPVK